MKDLLPCPFCGGEISITYYSADNVFSIWHKNDGCEFIEPMYIDGEHAKSLSDARNIWNKRAAPELIRCKDCKWYDERISMCDNCGLPREQNFFCADGERKGETEIIRCKDCKHFVAEDQPCKYHGMYISLKPDNYCTHGERR